MPLTSREITHILAVIPKTFAGRQSTVVLVTLTGSVYAYSTLQAILRPVQVTNPETADTSQQDPRRAVDALLIAPLGTSFTGVVFVANTATPTAAAVAAAVKYELVEIVPMGLLPGGTHIKVLLHRFR